MSNLLYNQELFEPMWLTGPVGFDPMTCGSEDRRDILTTLRTLLLFFWYVLSWQLYNLSWFNLVEFSRMWWIIDKFTRLLLSVVLLFLVRLFDAKSKLCLFLDLARAVRLGNRTSVTGILSLQNSIIFFLIIDLVCIHKFSKLALINLAHLLFLAPL